ncbi:MAG: glycerophosphodiester phosphodiesterase family protein [Verrucomicrobia bacterium]|nr:glycerophosphodiester phosphodiesterase family protein [Verrucomicrobiota bacterium]
MNIPRHFLLLSIFTFLCLSQTSRGNKTGILAGPLGSVVSIAHRGAVVPEYPENTLMAFRKAMQAGSEVVEIDLRSSKDGEIVILHDSTLDRTTNGTGPVSDYTLTELKRLDAGMGERIPTYSEVLQLVSSTNAQLLLDLKVTSLPELTKIVRLTEKHGHVLNVIAAVRSLEELKDIQSLNPNLRTLAFIPEREDIETYSKAGVDIIRLWPDWIREDPNLVKKVHSLGNTVWTTSMKAKNEELKELIGYGVNGLFTDFPEMVSRMRAELE